jgi:hypothetical protein
VRSENASWWDNKDTCERFGLCPKESNFGYVRGWMRPHTIIVMEGDSSAFRQVETINLING